MKTKRPVIKFYPKCRGLHKEYLAMYNENIDNGVKIEEQKKEEVVVGSKKPSAMQIETYST